MKLRQVRYVLAVALLSAAGWSAQRAIVSPAIVRAQDSAPAAPAAQAPAGGAPVLRAESRVVRVDVIVTDKKGHYIPDLAAKDFHVFDNDKEQPIVNFSFGASAGAAAAQDRHYMVLLFDDATMEMSDQPRARQAALKFIDANAGPDRVMAVADFTGTLRIMQNFTMDADRLKRAAASYKPSAVSTNGTDDLPTPSNLPGPANPSISDAQNDFGVHTFLLAVRSLARNLAPVPGRKSLILFTDGFPATPEQQAELTATISTCNQANVAVYPLDVRGLIAAAPGPGAQLRRDDGSAPRSFAASHARATDESSARPRLVLTAYPVPAAAASPEPSQKGGGGGGGHGGVGGGGGIGGGGGHGGGTGGGTGGTGGGTGGGGSRGGGTTGGPAGGGGMNPGMYGMQPFGNTSPQMLLPTLPETGVANQSVLYELAVGTGGFPIYNTNDLLGGLAKIAHEQDEYYLLGYAPSASDDGTCHTLRVKVDRGGTSVRSRTGYCSAKPQDLLIGKPIEKDLEAHATGSAAGGIGGTLETPFVYTAPNEARVSVAMEIPSSSVEFSKEKGKYHADINVLGIAYRPDGSVGARFSDEVILDLEKDAWKHFTQKPMHYDNQFQIASGAYKLAVVLSAGGQSFGKFESPLAIDPFDGKTFTMSAIALSNDVEPAAGLGGALEADLLSDRAPLVVKDMEIVPYGSNNFKRTDPVAMYAQIYNTGLAGPNPPAVRLSYRIVDVKTGEAVIGGHDIDASAYIIKGSPVLPVGLKVPVDQLQPGSYRLDLQASDGAGGRTTIRAVQFDAE